MKFIVTKTSEYDYSYMPCEEAKPMEVFAEDNRGWSWEEMQTRFPEFFKSGILHERTKTNGTRRLHKLDEPRWFIKIKNLKELIAFQAKYGRIIIAQSEYHESAAYDNPMMEIEIYNDYRE